MLWEAGSEARAPCLGFSLRSTELRARQPPLVFPKAAGGQNAEQKAARWRDEWQGPPSLRLHPACRISPGPPLRPSSGPLFPTGLQSRPQVTQEAKCPSAAPRRQPAPHLPSRLPRQILSALRACLFLPGEDRGDSVPTYRPRALCQPRTPLAPRLTHELLQSSISWFAYLGVSILRICQSHDLIFFFFFKEDLFHLPLVNPCWKLLKSPDNGK